MEKNKHLYASKDTRLAYAFCLPIILFSLMFIVVPVFGTLITSFFRDVTFLDSQFIAWKNYGRLFSDIQFWQSLRFTLVFVILSVGLELILGLIFALLLNEYLPARGFFRVVMLIPWAIPIAISGRIWEFIYHFEFGLINFLALKTGLLNQPINWLGSSDGAFFAIVISDVWKTTPFIAIILLAGLSNIPRILYSQAMIDGAGSWQRFYRITLPLLKPVIIVALLFRTIDAIRIFDLIYVLTGGGPGGSTTSLSLYAFKHYLSGDFGYGSAISIVIFLTAGMLSILYIKLGRFGEGMR